MRITESTSQSAQTIAASPGPQTNVLRLPSFESHCMASEKGGNACRGEEGELPRVDKDQDNSCGQSVFAANFSPVT